MAILHLVTRQHVKGMTSNLPQIAVSAANNFLDLVHGFLKIAA